MTLADLIHRRTGLRVTVEHQDNGIFVDSDSGCAFFPAGTPVDEMVRVIASKPLQLPLFNSTTYA
jgi:hypothetical protein